VGEQTPKGLAARKFAKLLKEKSNGYIEVQVFPNGKLYKDGEEMDALLKGNIQMIAPATSKLTSIVPEWQALDLPFAFQNVEEIHEYLDGDLGEDLFLKLQTKGFYPLGIWDNGFKQMTNHSLALISPHNFTGIRFRIMPSTVIKEQFTELNALTQSNSYNEVYQLLESGIIDGQENTLSNIVNKDLHSFQNFITISNHGYLGYTVLVNKEFWDELPQDVQTLVEETFQEVTKWEIELAKELNEKSLNAIESCNCIDIHVLTEQERQLWEEAFEPVYEKFTNRFGAEYMNSLPRFKED
jgi:tripartite ATP-independent transporter DctP family solute receptor